MDKLCLRGKRNVKNASEGTHSNKNSLSISGEERAGLTFSLPHHPLEDVQAKRNKLLRSNHPYYRNVQNISGENLRLLNSKILPIFGSTSATSVNAHFLQCRVSRFVRVLQTAIYNHYFIVTHLSRISQNWFPTASGVLLLVSRIISLNKCNRFRYNI